MGTNERPDGGKDRGSRLRRVLGWAARSYVVLIVLGIVVGLQIAPAVSNLAPGPDRGSVAVVSLQGGIDGVNAASVTSRLERVREDSGIDAVVLVVNSGGGGAASSEEIYMAVRRTAERKPVVASVGGIAASGAYYSVAPADTIYTRPTSFVGSVGVTFTAPADAPPVDRQVITGPNKLTGGDLREWEYKIESARRAFVGAVEKHRGDRLNMTTEQLSYARLYTGAEGVENGLADEIGGTQDAIDEAARLADLSGPRVRYFGYQGTVSFVTQRAYVAADVEDKELVSPATFVREPGTLAVPNPLMLPASVVRAGIVEQSGEPATNTTEVRTDVAGR